MTERLLTDEQLAQVLASAPDWTPDKAAQMATLLQGAGAVHKPVLRHHQGRNRIDCTCGAQGLGEVAPTAGMAPVLRVMKAHRDAQ
jgi:hypothetical protein